MPFVPAIQFELSRVAHTRLCGFRVEGSIEMLHDLAKEIAALQFGPSCRVEIEHIQARAQTRLAVSVQGAYPYVARQLFDQRVTEGYHLSLVDDWFEIVAYEYSKEFVPSGGDSITDEHPF